MLRTMAAGAAAATAASLLGRFDWRLSLLSHFRLHLAAGCLAGLAASAASRLTSRRSSAARPPAPLRYSPPAAGGAALR